MTVKLLAPSDDSVIRRDYLEALLNLPAVQGYIDTLERVVPGLDARIDYALALGFLAVREYRAGRLGEYLDLAALTFDRDEHADLAAAALAYLEPLSRAAAAAAAGVASLPEPLDVLTEPATDPDL